MKLYIVVLMLMIGFINFVYSTDYTIYDTKTKKSISISEMAELSQKFDVIFFGEFHDDSLVHQIQNEYTQSMYSLNNKTVVSMEMFERDVQQYLNDYFAGKITEEVFLKNSRPWPDYAKFYKPMVELAKSNNSTVIAANIPRKYAAMFASGGMTGISKLPDSVKPFITRSMLIEDGKYMDKFFETMAGENQKHDTLPANKENTFYLYYGAQLIKDETMAESIADYLNNVDKSQKIIHYNGDFHSNSYLGTAEKLRERIKNIKMAVITLTYNKDPQNFEITDEIANEGDFYIVLKEKKAEPQDQMMSGFHFGENAVVYHKVDISIDPENSFLSGTDEFKFKNPILKKSSVKLLKSLEITDVKSLDGKFEYKIVPIDDNYNEIIFENPTVGKSGNMTELSIFKISYKGKVMMLPSETNLLQRHSNSAGIISGKVKEGIYLPSRSFYPAADKDLADFEIKAEIPADYELITSAEPIFQIENGKKKYSFKSKLPVDDMTIVGGKFLVSKRTYDNKEFRLYSFDSLKVAEQYLTATEEYYKLYTELFGAYPFESFSIVENFFATGFGMPSYTLLSGKLIAMPWVTLSPGSLAHEFVHNWWGNSVYTDYESGNWCEALTTFSTNYYYNVLKNNEADALDWRKKALISISALPEDRNYPVNEFKYQKDMLDAVIGYQKGAFIFYEIYKLMGKESFFNSLKNFATKNKGKRAYWFNLLSSFNEQAKKDSISHPIRKTFDSWLKNKNVPLLKLENVEYSSDSITVTISQSDKNYISVPITIANNETSKKEYVIIKDTINTIKIANSINADFVAVDKDYEVLRQLYSWEKPYSFNRTLSDKPIVVMPDKKSPDYKFADEFFAMLVESGYNFEQVLSSDVNDEIIKNNSLIILGNFNNNKLINSLQNKYPKELKFSNNMVEVKGKADSVKNYLVMLNTDHPSNINKLCTVINFENYEKSDSFKRLFHYLTYSLVVLNNTKPGRPVMQSEIFPDIKDKSQLQKRK